MKFIDEIYVGRNVKDLGTIVYALKRKIHVLNIYCICVNENGRTEILSSKELSKGIWSDIEYTILGIALGKKEAYSVIKFIAEDAYLNYNSIEDYINELCKTA